MSRNCVTLNSTIGDTQNRKKRKRKEKLIPLTGPVVDILNFAQHFSGRSAALLACIADNYTYALIRDFVYLGIPNRRSTKKGQLRTCRSVLEFKEFSPNHFPDSPLVGPALAPLVKFPEPVRGRVESAPSSYRSQLNHFAEVMGIGWPMNYPAVVVSAQHSKLAMRKSPLPPPLIS